MKTYKPIGSDDITKTAKRMVALAKKTNGSVKTNFNEIILTANPGDDPDTIVRYYQTESIRLHEEYVKSPEYKKWWQRAKKAQRCHDLMLKGALEAAPKKMTLRDEEGWKRVVANTDDELIRFAERWARLMECRMANGDTLEACADETYSLANNEGVSGFAYGCIVAILSWGWIHGEQLRRWHNLKTQIGHEGEKANKDGSILNPALLSFD